MINDLADAMRKAADVLEQGTEQLNTQLRQVTTENQAEFNMLSARIQNLLARAAKGENVKDEINQLRNEYKDFK